MAMMDTMPKALFTCRGAGPLVWVGAHCPACLGLVSRLAPHACRRITKFLDFLDVPLLPRSPLVALKEFWIISVVHRSISRSRQVLPFTELPVSPVTNLLCCLATNNFIKGVAACVFLARIITKVLKVIRSLL